MVQLKRQCLGRAVRLPPRPAKKDTLMDKRVSSTSNAAENDESYHTVTGEPTSRGLGGGGAGKFGEIFRNVLRLCRPSARGDSAGALPLNTRVPGPQCGAGHGWPLSLRPVPGTAGAKAQRLEACLAWRRKGPESQLTPSFPPATHRKARVCGPGQPGPPGQAPPPRPAQFKAGTYRGSCSELSKGQPGKAVCPGSQRVREDEVSAASGPRGSRVFTGAGPLEGTGGDGGWLGRLLLGRGRAGPRGLPGRGGRPRRPYFERIGVPRSVPKDADCTGGGAGGTEKQRLRAGGGTAGR